MIMQTDKSRKLTINKPDNYIEQMKPHLRNDTHVTTDEQKTMERTLTGHAIQWGTILRMDRRGDNLNNGKRWTRKKSTFIPRQHSHPHCMACPKITRNYQRGERTRDTQCALFVVPLKA